MPLTSPGHDLSEGAVYSLIPDEFIPLIPSGFNHGGPQFVNLPDPNIPNSTWFAISSYFPDNGGFPTAVMRDFLQAFLGATQPSNGPTISRTSMLGDQPNDVIVTTDSQTYHAIPGQSRSFPYLAHSDTSYIGPALQSLGLGWDNRNVTQSPAVNQQVASWLGYNAANPVPTKAIPFETTDETSQSGIADSKPDFSRIKSFRPTRESRRTFSRILSGSTTT